MLIKLAKNYYNLFNCVPRGWAIVSHISAHIFSNQTCLNKKKCLLKSKKKKNQPQENWHQALKKHRYFGS